MSLFNLVQVNTATVGTGTLALGSPVDGGRDFSSIPDGTTVSYAIVDIVSGTTFREVGRGVKTGTSLTRSLLQSTTGALLNLSGNANVSVSALAEDFSDAAAQVPERIPFGSPLSTWIVNHNRGRSVLVDVYSAGNQKVLADVRRLGPNQVEVNFDVPSIGYVIVH